LFSPTFLLVRNLDVTSLQLAISLVFNVEMAHRIMERNRKERLFSRTTATINRKERETVAVT
jgi:hypothetical protein